MPRAREPASPADAARELLNGACGLCDCGSLCDCGEMDCRLWEHCGHRGGCGLHKQLQRERIDAKNGLEGYASAIKNILNSERFADEIGAVLQRKLLDAVNASVWWLGPHDESLECLRCRTPGSRECLRCLRYQGYQEALKEEYELSKKELEDFFAVL